MNMLEMNWMLLWTTLSGIGGLIAVITIIVTFLKNQTKKREKLMHTCNELCDAMSVSKIYTLLNNIGTICDKGMTSTSDIMGIQNTLLQMVQEFNVKWGEMQLLIKSSRLRTMREQIEAIVAKYHCCIRDIETIVYALGCGKVDDIKKHVFEENSQELHDIISSTIHLYNNIPSFVKQIIALRFKDLEVPNYAAEIRALFKNQNKDDSIFIIRIQSILGDAIAQNELACYYYDRKQLKKAFLWYKKAAEQANAVAQYNLAVCYSKGEGIKKDEKEAITWYKKAAEQGHIEAQNSLGYCYKYGEGVEKDEKEAVAWYKKAAEQGNALAQFNLGNCLIKGEGVEKDENEAVVWYKKAARQGDIGAQYDIGVCYSEGKGVEKDEKEAVAWYKKAAEQGYAMAQYNYGNCLLMGKGVEKDEKEAVVWYKKAAEQGCAEAQHNIGVCYEKGDGVEKDEKEAFSWYKKSAEQGNAIAQFNLGMCYLNGEGCIEDYNKAYYWFNKATDNKEDVKVYSMAIYAIGNMYMDRKIGFGSPYVAVDYFTIAAQNGLDIAQCKLAYCYENEIGVKEADIEKAKYWYREAAKQGDKGAFESLKRLGAVINLE